MAAASQLWYVPHRPDLVLLAPCDGEGPLPCSGSMYVSIDHLHPPERADRQWRHPRSTGYLTCFGDIAKQQPRVVRCVCGASPCTLRSLQERGGVPDGLIPADWATKYELPPNDAANAASETRRTTAVQLWLDCTAKAEREIPPEEGKEQPPEEKVLAAAEPMLTDYLKGRVCFHCNLPSSRMQRCSRCLQTRYCSKECQRTHWATHKQECAAAAVAAAAAPAKSSEPEAAAATDGGAAAATDGTAEPVTAAADAATPSAPAS